MFKAYKKSIISFFLVVYLIFAPTFLFSNLKMDTQFLSRENKIDYYGVLELWNVDTFEGGSVARSLWLEKRALEFEKQNPGTFILIRNMTKEQAILNLQNGNEPTLISYGIGFGSVITSYLTNYTGRVNVRDDLLVGGKINGTIMAVPYILGGYSLIFNNVLLQKLNKTEEDNLLENVFELLLEERKKNTPSLSFSGLTSTNAPLSLYFNIEKTASDNNFTKDYMSLPPYETYENFVLKNTSICLLGTQRDVYRTQNRMNNQPDEEYIYKFLEGFSDLIQYISIFSCDNVVKEKCVSFIEYLTSEKVQQTLVNIAMFSTLNMNIYSDSFYKEWEKVLLKPLKTFNVFLQDEILSDKQKISLEALKGNEEAINKINTWF